MTIKQQGGIFGRNPSFNDVESNTETTNTLIVNQKVGVLNSDPQAALHIGSNATNPGTAGYTTLLISDTANGAQMALRGLTPKLRFDATGGGNSEIYYDYDLIFKDQLSDATRMTFTEAGNIAFPSGNGIDFSATSGTGTSELFSDYEEGAYTAVLTPSTSGSITLNSSLQTLSYTKVGRVVSVFGLVLVGSVSSPVGAIRVNLPTTIASTNLYSTRASGSVTCTAVASANISDFVVNAVEGNAYFQIGLGDATSIQNDAAQQMQSNSQISITFSYISA